MNEHRDLERPEAIAVVGLAGRFPGAETLEGFWRNLRAGVCAISRFDDRELEAAGVARSLRSRPEYVPAAGVLEGVELFDAPFFGFTAREAELLDPQHRLFLECAYQALEDAAYDPVRFEGRIGLFGSAGANHYFLANLWSHPELLEELGATAVQLLNQGDFLCTRVSYHLDLSGPSASVQAACSSSLLAVHLACQSLLTGECDMALAGGVSIHLPQKSGYLYQEGGILSRDGRCRAFDAAATGTVPGSGVGMVVLKRAADAYADGDAVRAVVLGSAANNDGARKAGFTAPSVERQAEVIAEAMAMAGVEAAGISYVEAHGSGTPIGDPIELAALSDAFGATTGRRGVCALGSVKSNVGHLNAAAGIAGLIKTVLALEHRELPPSLDFERPNPEIDFDNSPFFVNTSLRPWTVENGRRRAGVSALGLGGTNVHVVLENAPSPPAAEPSRPQQLLVLSARTRESLEASSSGLADYLEANPELVLADVAYTLGVGRRELEHRRFLIAADTAGAVSALRAGRWLDGSPPDASRSITFLFPGLGDLLPGMSHELYDGEPVFRRELDRCAGLLTELLGEDPLAALYPPGLETGGGGSKPDLARLLRRRVEPDEGATDRLAETRLAQPVLFAVEHALARLLISWGLTPRALLGHSLGEYVAACLAGVLDLEDALALVVGRAERIDALPEGAMLAVPAGAEALRGLLADRLELSAIHGPELCVVGGSRPAVDDLVTQLERQGLSTLRLRARHPFHTRWLAPAAPAVTELTRSVRRRPPRIPYLSATTGDWLSDAEAVDPEYWARHMCSTVRFGDGLTKLLEDPGRVFLEVGPGNSLSALVHQHPGATESSVACPTLGHRGDGGSEVGRLLEAVGRLWLSGVAIDWPGFYAPHRRRRLSLPTYPFERRRYWIDPPPVPEAPAVAGPRLAGAEDPAPQAEPAAIGAQESWLDFLELEAPPRAHRGAQTRDRAKPEHDPAASEEPRRHTELHPRDDLSSAFVAPSTATERRLAAIWQGLFGIEPIGTEDNFFELGGYSLLGIQVVSRVRHEFGVDVEMIELFELPTVAELAVRIDATGRRQPAGDAPAPIEADAGPERPLSHAQQRLWFLSRLQPESPAYNLTEARILHGRLRASVLERVLSEVSRRHEVLRAWFPARGEQPVQRIAEPCPTALPRIDLRGLESKRRRAEARRLAAIEAARPFDLTRPPLVRFLLLRLADQHHALVFNAHHIVFDGWSMEVLLREVAALYPALAVGERSPLAELPIQYSDYAAWERSWLAGETLAAQLDYWLDHLGAEPPLLRLPGDRARPAIPNPTGAKRTFRLPPAIVRGVERLGRRQQATPYMTVLAALAVLLARLSGQDRLIVGMPMANRDRPETEMLIGCFVNVLPLCIDLAGNPTYLELLARVREAVLGAFAHRRLPLDLLVASLREQQRLGDDPLIRLTVGIQNAPPAVADRSGLEVNHLELPRKTVRFDLTVWIVESPEGSLDVAWTCRAERFESVAVERLHRRLERLLEQILAAPEARILTFESVAESERRALAGRRGSSGERPGRRRLKKPVRRQLRGRAAGGAPRGAAPAAPPPIRRAAPADSYPLSFDQERLWLIQRLDPDNTAYNIYLAMWLEGRLDLPALERSLGEIVRRHEIWRTTFPDVDGKPEQRIAPYRPVSLPTVDLRRLAGGPGEERLAELVQAEAERPFDLARGPVLRVLLVRSTAERYLFLVTVHHIVNDWFSANNFQLELVALYRSYAARRPSPLPEPQLQYVDFALWQRQWMRGETLRRYQDFWRRELAEMPRILELPHDRPPLSYGTGQGLKQYLVLDRRRTDGLKALSGRESASLFMTLVAVYGTLLMRFTGQERLLMATPSDQRRTAELRPLLGFFLTLLIYAADLSGDPGFREMLRRVRAHALRAYRFADMPFSKLLETLGVERHAARHPLVQTTVNLLDAELAPISMPGLRVEPFSMDDQGERFELTLTFWDTAEGELHGWLKYNRVLFDPTTVARMARCLYDLVDGLLAAPDVPISRLPLLSGSTRHQLLVEWNETGFGNGSDRSASASLSDATQLRFAEMARAHPEASALTCEGGTLSDRELTARPVDGVRVLVLDRRLCPVPIGVVGELAIGGDSVARGYLGRPAAIAERFVPDPAASGFGARIYRSGVRVRCSARGSLEFLGRTDH